MNNTRRKEINRLASIVREEFNLTTPVTLSALEKMIKELGGTLNKKGLPFDTDAEIRKTGEDNFSITLNTENYASPEREKFTLAHELGHLFIHMGFATNDSLWNGFIDNFNDTIYNRKGYSEQEYEAHEFAAALLMPEDEFEEFFNIRDGSICDIEMVANKFGISIDAAINRGKWLGHISWTER